MFEHKKQLLHEVKVEKGKSTICCINARTIRWRKWRVKSSDAVYFAKL